MDVCINLTHSEQSRKTAGYKSLLSLLLSVEHICIVAFLPPVASWGW